MLLFVLKKSALEAVIVVSVFLHLLTNQRVRACFKFFLRFADENFDYLRKI